MDDTLNLGVLAEYALESLEVATVNLLESRTDAGDLFDTIYDIGIRIRQIVDDYNFVACFLQFYSGVTADKTGSTCYKNCLFHNVLNYKDIVFLKVPSELNSSRLSGWCDRANRVEPDPDMAA